MPGSSDGLEPAVVTMRPSTLYDSLSQRLARSASRPSRWSSSRRLDCSRSRYSRVPNAAIVIPSATVYHRVSRCRIVRTSHLHDVPDAAHRVHQLLRVARVDLLAEPVDHHVHDVGAGVEVVVPGVLGDEGPRHDPAGVAHEVLQHRVLLRGEVDPLARPAHLAGGGIELELAYPEDRIANGLGPPSERLHPREQLLEGERFGDVVVGAGAQ